MASYNELNALIDAYINRNGVQAITGQILNGVLKAMVEQLGRGYTIMGAAIPTTDPGTPDGPECYFASETGTYTDFDGLQVAPGELALLCYTPSDGWTKATIYEGFQEVGATIDGNVGTPSVGVSYANGVLSFDFHDMKGNPGQNGQDGAAAGFGTIGADITGGVGTPGVTVESSGPATAKNLQFHFTNLKGETGVTSVVATVDNTTGTPACTVSLVGQQLTLAFSGLKGAQGDTGSSVDYPFTIVNNLTTDDATQALSAAQGVVLDGKVTQLEAEVTDIDDTINGKQIVDKSDTVGTLLNKYISASHDTHEGVAYSNYNLYKSTDYLPVVGGSTIMISVFGTNSSTGDAGIAFYDSNKAVIPNTGLKYLNESAVNNDVRTIVVPSGASYTRTTIDRNIGSTVVFKVVVFGESYEERISKLESETDALSAENAELKSSLISLDTEFMNLDDKSIISVDLMQMVHALNNISSLDYMDVLSASESSITLSSADAQKFPASPTYGTVAVVGFSNGEYKVVYFGSPSGTTIPRASFETTDLTNATKVQSLHDTLPGANGQHLSPSGYIAMGKFVADEIQRQASMIDKNWLGGLVFNKLGPSKGYQNTDENNAVYDLDDNVVCRPEFYNWMWGSYTPNGNNVPNDRGVGSSAHNALANGWVQKAYYFIQGKKDAYIEFPIEIHGTGFVEIQAAKRMRYSTSNGGCRLDVFADGENVGSYELTLNQTRYVFENVTVSNELRVRFTLLDNADTEVSIYSIGMWKMYQGVNTPNISSFTKIAVLGDSWTQFPGVGNGLSDHSSWNEVITRPDGTNGDGYGYFTRELSRYTGASVDNWGKANMTAENWGLVKIDEVLNHAFYDYLIVEFFINDINAGTPSSSWISNIKAICNKCKRAGVRPVFIMPCGTNSYSQATSLGIWHEAVLEGLGKK